ncbi:MAG: aminotransferase class III-fold pyridoxal phosphate-dependent enzyme [Acidobacteriaceae bacterium]|nr:aminotransferase class III-fold pyridoxal phosphate-dependent enzyme [Acidobacteriaceae bacterium]
MNAQWLPFTPNRDFLRDPKMFARASGVFYTDVEGRSVLDGASGLFTTPAGHARVEIADAVREQMLALDFTPSFLRGHNGSFALAEQIVEILPKGMERVFFVNSGSEAVDTALKICLAYHRARRDSGRQMFVSRERAYHGVNFGGVALAGMVNNRRAFGAPALPVAHMRHTWQEQSRFTRGQATTGAELADDLLRMIRLYGAENIAACVVEPIAGSTGVLVPPVGYLERLRAICDEYGLLLVFDEVICGFGRTGKAFAAQSFGVTPDIITMAKAITNGCVPMGAVAVGKHVYEAVVEAAAPDAIELFHGYTWSAHPVACAAGIATQTIFQQEKLFARSQHLSGVFLETLYGLEDLPGVTDIRGFGMLGGVDTDPKVLGVDGYVLQKRLFDRGLHIKTTGDCAIFAPPFVSTSEQIQSMIGIFRDTVGDLVRGA